MALYDGFFDAEQSEETGEYDRAYQADDFTGYFANVIGSGVCVHNNPDSFKVRLEDGRAVVSPGYLFIQGYWLKNDADYTVSLPGSGNYAIVAHLNLGARMIELEARAVEKAYTDSLVLAIVSPTAAEDTRYNTDLCGVIDTAGELSTKVEWAINYIDNEIESKLADVERQIAAQSSKLDAKIAEVQAIADSIVPPPVGTIKFSASQNVGDEWLRCDGRFINERDYPELVAALGKLTPSNDKFKLISNGEIAPQISNGVIYGGRMWVYSYSAQKLYGIDLAGSEAPREIVVASEDSDFTRVHTPTTKQPIALSIVKSPIGGTARLFLAQILTQGGSATGFTSLKENLWLYSALFTGNGTTLSVAPPFNKLDAATAGTYFDYLHSVPYVISQAESGAETFYMATGVRNGALRGLKWTASGGAEGFAYGEYISGDTYYLSAGQRTAYSAKNKDEMVYFRSRYNSSSSSQGGYYRSVMSYQKGTFGTSVFSTSGSASETISTPTATNIAGENSLIIEAESNSAIVVPLKTDPKPQKVNYGLSLPSAARIFVDGGAYLWGKDIYMLFVGTGIIFSRTLEEGDFGYLDTTEILGQITQFGYLDYSKDEGALYLLGQDTTNTVKVAKIVLNTLYDYANDGAWLPMIAADGVPAYIKASESGGGVIPDPVDMKISVTLNGSFSNSFELLFNGEVLIGGTFTRTVSQSGTFTVGIRVKKAVSSIHSSVSLNGTKVVGVNGTPAGGIDTATFRVSDYVTSGITLVGIYNG